MRKAMAFLIVMMTAALGAQQGAPGPASKSQAAPPARKAARPQALPADAPTRQEVLKLFELLQISKTMDFGIKTAKQQSMEMAEQMVQEKAPDATPEQKKQFEAMIDDVMNDALGPAAIRQIIEATIPIYQRHLTRADLKAMVDFYSSPVGRKILREQPAMVEESMRAASAIQEKIARSVFLKIDQRMQEIAQPDKQRQ